MNIGTVITMSRRCASKKSDVQSDISTIFTTNSRAGCENADEPSPRPYHLPDHHAGFVSSCLSSRERKTEIKIFWIAR